MLDQRSRLGNEIEKYEAELGAALVAEEPYANTVGKAKRELFALYRIDGQAKCVHRVGAVADVLAAHDAYVAARVAWWPFGGPVKQLTRALKEVRRELKIVNAEIGV